MKTNFIKTANVKALATALNRVHTLNPKSNRMALVFGEHGLGKTEAIINYQANTKDVVMLRVKALVSPRWLLTDLVTELGEQPLYRTAALFNQAREQLTQHPRLVIVDEADYLLRDSRCIETLRDLHDTTLSSICIVGMGLIDKKLNQYKHLVDRFAEKVKLTPLPLADIKTIAAENCSVRISDDAAEYLHRTDPRWRWIVQTLEHAERIAQVNGLKEITAAHLMSRK